MAILVILLAGTIFSVPAASAQERQFGWLRHFKIKIVQPTANLQSRDEQRKTLDEAELLESSREAGLLTDWHLDGHFGHGGRRDFAHRFAPEKAAAEQAAKFGQSEHHELVFVEGSFALPRAMAAARGIFYADSCAYLSGSGDFTVYLESGDEAVVFFDGRRVLKRPREATGVTRGRIHAESGYHNVLVKFTAQAAPFRLAILPPNSGSRRKNNTPYMQASPAFEDLTAKKIGDMPKTGGY